MTNAEYRQIPAVDNNMGLQMATSTERARALNARRKEAGLVQLNVWVPANQYADARVALLQLAQNENYELGPLRDVSTGRLVGRNK